jgi:hypothetical protein
MIETETTFSRKLTAGLICIKGYGKRAKKKAPLAGKTGVLAGKVKASIANRRIALLNLQTNS